MMIPRLRGAQLLCLQQPTAGHKCTIQSRLMSAAGRPSFLWCSFSHDSQHHMQQRGQQEALQGSTAATDRSSDGNPFPNEDLQLRIGTSGNMATSSAGPHHTNIQPAAPQHVLWHKSHLPTTTAANSTPVIDAHQLRLSTPDSRRSSEGTMTDLWPATPHPYVSSQQHPVRDDPQYTSLTPVSKVPLGDALLGGRGHQPIW